MWLEIKKQLEIAIINGTYKSAEKFPSINEIKDLFSCGNSTAQKVLNAMYSEGTITKQKGIGYFVKPFVQKQLLEKYTAAWRNRFSQDINEAKLLNISRKSMEGIFEQLMGSIYSP